MPLSLRNKINIPIGFALAILAIIGVVSYQSVKKLDQSAHWVDHTQEVLGTIEAVKSNIEEAKSNQRGYVITGSDEYLRQYASAKQQVSKMLADVRSQTSDNPDQQKRLDLLTSLITARLASLDHTITMRSQQGFRAAATSVGSVPARLLTVETEKVISEMEQAERVLLAERDAVEKSRVRATELIIIFGSLLAFSIVPVAAVLLNREIEKRADAERRIVAKTEDLAASERESHQKSQILESVLDSMGDGVAVVDDKGNFLLFNPAAEKILGVGAKSMPRQEWSHYFGIFSTDGVTPVAADDIPLARALRGEIVKGQELFVRNPKVPDGIWINVTATPLADEGDLQRGGVAVFRDISRSKQAEELLVRAKDEAERATKFKDQFLSTMSHELRTPLNAVLGFSDLLADERYGSLNERQQRYVNNIHTGGQHLLRLISDILDLSKIQAGRMELTIQDLPISSAFEGVISALKPLTDRKSQILALTPSDLIVRADPTRLKQMLMNLVGNAIKFTPVGGKIDLAAKQLGDRIQIEVSDNGPGIPAEEQKRIFRAFYRLKQSDEPIEGSTGLGLAITRRLAELHGGGFKCGKSTRPRKSFLFLIISGYAFAKPTDDRSLFKSSRRRSSQDFGD